SRLIRKTPANSGRPHQKPRPTKIATNTGARAVPRPSNAFNTSTARSCPSGWNADAKVLSAGTVSPNPAPRKPVAVSSKPYATGVLPVNPQLTISSAIATTSAPSPARYRRLDPNRDASPAPRSDAVIASTTCGRNIAPYWVLDRP